MSTSTQPPMLIAAALAATSAGLEPHTLKALEPDGFGSPGHWRLVGNTVVYTERGIELLVESLTARGYITAASGLYAALVRERQERATPSRSLIPPGPKSSDFTQHAWQRRADCA
jgi:hypothetical protein